MSIGKKPTRLAVVLHINTVFNECCKDLAVFVSICIFCRTARLPHRGGRGRLLTDEQETAVVNMVLANNVITLRQIRDAIIADQHIFQNIATVSLSTVDRVLQRNSMRMKQVYRVPFERNTARIKEIRHDYVQVSPIHSTTVSYQH